MFNAVWMYVELKKFTRAKHELYTCMYMYTISDVLFYLRVFHGGQIEIVSSW